jgi:hypothetical protein
MSFAIITSSDPVIDILNEDFNVYLLDCSSNDINVYLPELEYDGVRIYIKRTDTSSNTCTVHAPSNFYIDTVSTKSISSLTCMSFINYGGNWFILSLT